MRPENLCSMSAFLEPRELRARIARYLAEPLHQMQGGRVVLIIGSSRGENREFRLVGDVVDACKVGTSGQQDQCPDFRMMLGQCDRVANAATAAPDGDSRLVDARL